VRCQCASMRIPRRWARGSFRFALCSIPSPRAHAASGLSAAIRSAISGVGHRHSLPQCRRPVSALCSAGDAVPALAQMKHWELSGQKARKMMNNYFHRVEVHSEASHLQDYVDDHPFLGDHPRASVSAAIKRSLSLSSEQRRMCTHSHYVQVECGNSDRLSGLGTGALASSVWWATQTRATRATPPRGQAGRWHERFPSRSCTGRRTTKRCELSRARHFAQLEPTSDELAVS
jgi:hypothetical protein